MKTLMRNGRDRRSENPGWATRRKSARFCLGPISGSHQGQRPDGCIQRPDTWLHPNASLICQIPLAPRAPSIHGPFETSRLGSARSTYRGKAAIGLASTLSSLGGRAGRRPTTAPGLRDGGRWSLFGFYLRLTLPWHTCGLTAPAVLRAPSPGHRPPRARRRRIVPIAIQNLVPQGRRRSPRRQAARRDLSHC
jgi:hypothetical protein